MEDYTITDHKHMLGTLVQQVRDLLVKAKNNDLKQFGITVRQLAVLDIIGILGNKATPTEISIRLLRQPHCSLVQLKYTIRNSTAPILKYPSVKILHQILFLNTSPPL